MSNSKLSLREKMTERLIFALSPSLKRDFYEAAAYRGRSVSDLAREAIRSLAGQPN